MRKAAHSAMIGGEYALLEALREKGVAVPKATDDLRRIGEVGLPAFVVSVARDGAQAKTAVVRYGDIAPAIAKAVRTGSAVYVAQCVAGHEMACGVMADGRKTVPLVPVDAIPRSPHEALPWHVTERQLERVQALAKAAHRASGAGTHSCVRCIVVGHAAYVTSVEPAPALTPSSLFVRSAAVAGITLPELSAALGGEVA